MRKLFSVFVAIIAFAFAVQAQVLVNNPAITGIRRVNFYGVDFSQARAFGIRELPSQLKTGICSINPLFTTEQRKYDFPKFMGKTVENYYFNVTDKHNEDLDAITLTTTTNASYIIPSNNIQEIVNSLSTGNSNKVGLVFIAEMLNRGGASGTFYVVFFNEDDKKIIYCKKASGKPGVSGGVRNTWAASIFNILKDWKY